MYLAIKISSVDVLVVCEINVLGQDGKLGRRIIELIIYVFLQ